MARIASALLVLAVVFLAGVLTGRAWQGGGGDADGVDPDGAAVDQPGGPGNPFPVGVAGEVGAWAVEVVSFEPRGTERVLAANQFNVEPGEGRTYALVTVTIRRLGTGPAVLSGSLSPALVVPAGTSYPLGRGCGVLPDPLDPNRLVGRGEALTGQWCWPLPVPEVDKVDLRIAGTGGGEVWFEVR